MLVGGSPPDAVRALLSILEFEGPLLATVGAQLWTRAVQLPLDLQLQSVERHYDGKEEEQLTFTLCQTVTFFNIVTIFLFI